VTTDINGMKGSGCGDIVKLVQKAVGGTIVKEDTKPEFYDKNEDRLRVGS